MVMLTRRRDPDAGQESWLVYYGDVHVGTIGVRSGIPMTRCRGAGAAASIYPGSEPGECTSGTAATFDQARAAFESAWRLFRSKRPEADPGLARSARLDGGEILALRPRRARAA
jgi:hypothetical protein